MKFKDKYRFVRQNMKKNKSRLFMTILATSIGCCFLVVLASVGFGFQKSLTEVITSAGSLTEITVSKKDMTNPTLFTDDDVKFFESIKNVRSVA
jgi:acetoin utilization transport system permease protein